MQIEDELLENSLCKDCAFLVQRRLSTEDVELTPEEEAMRSEEGPYIIQALCRVLQDEIFLRVVECTAFVENKTEFFMHTDIWG